jgi:hypothetical protein
MSCFIISELLTAFILKNYEAPYDKLHDENVTFIFSEVIVILEEAST